MTDFRDVTVEIIWPDGRVSLRALQASDVEAIAAGTHPDWGHVAAIAARVGGGERPSEEEIHEVAEAALSHAAHAEALEGARVVGVDCAQRAIWAGQTMRSGAPDE